MIMVLNLHLSRSPILQLPRQPPSVSSCSFDSTFSKTAFSASLFPLAFPGRPLPLLPPLRSQSLYGVYHSRTIFWPFTGKNLHLPDAPSRKARAGVRDEGNGARGGWGGGGKGGMGEGGGERSSLAQICDCIESAFFELCIQNNGRSAAASIHDFVRAVVESHQKGISRQQLHLQLTYGSKRVDEFRMDVAGYRTTASEERYRSCWIDTIYLTLKYLERRGILPSSQSSSSPSVHGLEEDPTSFKREDDGTLDSMMSLVGEEEDVASSAWLINIIHRVVEGQVLGDDQSFVRFDRSLATGGASGGVAAEAVVIAPQGLPISQLVLLTLKVVNENRQI